MTQKENFTIATERNKAIARRFFQAFESNDRDALLELLASDVAFHPPGSAEPLNRQGFLQTIIAYKAAFSDQQYVIEEQIAEGDGVATRATWRAVHTGDYQGIGRTGKQVAIVGIALQRIKDGKIVEHRVSTHRLGLMQQLGLVPPPKQG